jgi:uncharacterized protein involved in copper resistance
MKNQTLHVNIGKSLLVAVMAACFTFQAHAQEPQKKDTAKMSHSKMSKMSHSKMSPEKMDKMSDSKMKDKKMDKMSGGKMTKKPAGKM